MAAHYTKTYVNWEQIPVILNVAQICILLQISDRTARNLLQNQKIKGKNIGGKWLVTKDSLLDYFNS